MEILYSVTVKPDLDIQNEFVEWLRHEHIDDVIGTGCFDYARLYKVMDENEADGFSINVQYITDSMQRYFDYIQDHSAEMRRRGIDRWQDKFVAFRTLLRSID